MIDRRQLLIGVAASAALLSSRRALAAGPSAAEVEALYKRSHVFDMLGGLDSGESGAVGNAELALFRDSGLTSIHVTVGVEGWEEAVASMAWHSQQAARWPQRLSIARVAADLTAARKARRLALILGTQGSLLLGRELERVDVLAGLGLRVFQLTYNRGDLIGDGCLEPRDAGLTTFGRELVARLDQARIAIDLSHCGARTAREAIAASKRPVLITHSGCSAVFAHPRNKDDATLKALADRGGVLGIYLMPFLGRPANGGPATAAMALDHIEHALKVCGEDHVGIGTDGGIGPVVETAEAVANKAAFVAARKKAGVSAPEEDRPLYVPELNTPRRYLTIAQGLARRGHSLRVIEKVLGLGFYKALATIWG